MSNNFIKILLYGSISIIIIGSMVLFYNYLNQSSREETTTVDTNIVYQAILDGDTEVYSKYLDDGGNLNFAYQDGRTPLEILIEADDLENVQKIMDNGFDLAKIDNNHMDTITNIIAYNQDFNVDLINDIVKELINQVKDEIEAEDTHGFSLLMNSLTTNNDDITNEVLKHVTDVDIEYNQETALTYACRLGTVDLSIIQQLINKGADINYKGEDGYNCLMNAIMSLDNDTVEYILTLPELDINSVNDIGQTALHICVEYTNIDAIDILLQNSTIDATIKDEDDRTAKDFALYLSNLHPDETNYIEIYNKL